MGTDINTSYSMGSHIIRADILRAMSKISIQLFHRIRDLLFHYQKGVILIQFYLVRVSHHLSFRALAYDVNRTES